MLYDMVIDLVDRLAQGMEVTPTQMLVLGKLKISFLNSNLLTINAPIILRSSWKWKILCHALHPTVHLEYVSAFAQLASDSRTHGYGCMWNFWGYPALYVQSSHCNQKRQRSCSTATRCIIG